MRNLQDVFSEVEAVPDFYNHKVDSVNYKNGYGDAPLHIVCGWGDCEAIRILIAAGADINAKGETGFTPLHYAVEQNHPEAIKLLLSLGAVTLLNDDDCSPIQLAKLLENVEAIEALQTTQ